ncbi:hypothetical protein BEI_1970 [Halomonas beimenensis]|uniref:Uncharacterized protein n=1 Tax=Halomonas beimenensis TaxID=475662 RepID=A0A291P7V3_9GAMM|nr:hypothetical protein BEI_1970 [Halomonas beimenensis]
MAHIGIDIGKKKLDCLVSLQWGVISYHPHGLGETRIYPDGFEPVP